MKETMTKVLNIAFSISTWVLIVLSMYQELHKNYAEGIHLLLFVLTVHIITGNIKIDLTGANISMTCRSVTEEEVIEDDTDVNNK